MSETEITVTRDHGYRAGDMLVFKNIFVPWYVRLWRWITRYKPPVYTVKRVTSTTFTLDKD